MKIIIPMSGTGNRYIQAGYQKIKPLIEIDQKPMVEHVMNLFPSEEDILFICNKQHLETTNLKGELNRICPTGKIITIDPHKLGPVYALSQAFDEIDDKDSAIVSYCDFSAYWNYQDFKAKMIQTQCDGCVPSYIGFHPHLLRPGFYAGLRVDPGQWMLEIKEKHSFTENKMDSFQSAGIYYFRKGSFIKKYCQALMDKKLSLNGEYYVSMIYQLMKEDKLNIFIYKLEYFMQWGTPQDLEEYQYWSRYFKTYYEKIEYD